MTEAAQLAKDAGVRRFVYMSSCSVYGIGGDSDVTEESPVNPQTAYAICKTLVERDVQQLANDNFSPVFCPSYTLLHINAAVKSKLVNSSIFSNAMIFIL